MACASNSRSCFGAALASGAALAVAPVFVTPVGKSANPSLRVSSQQAQAQLSSSAANETYGVASFLSVGTVAGVLAAAGTRSQKACRNFFGGDSSSSSYRSFDPATEAGVQDPVGFWDPLGLSADKDEATFKRRRAVEIKHGRIAMYATMGYIVPEYYKFPGFLSPSLDLKFADVPNGLAALSKVPLLGWVQIVWFIGLIEGSGFFSGKLGFGFQKDVTMAGEPGNYGVGFPTFLGKVEDPQARATKLSAELANGRLAMMAIIGMFFQDGLTGSAWGDWSLYTASPVRARSESKLTRNFFGGDSSSSSYRSFDPATEAGVQDPVGFWDPLGLSADKDEATFKRRRAVEIKHGRIAMYATMGYIVPEYYKFPGFLSPSLDLKFADVPNGLAALSKVPLLGWVQIVWFIGLIEGSGFFSGKLGFGFQKDVTMSGEPGNYGVGFPTFLGKVEDPQARATKLSAELANGRLAMMAIIGMFFQDGLTGSAWGDWALYTASPLRAADSDAKAPPPPPPFNPATQVGALAPLGFFDPAGFSKVGDKVGFNNLRAAEIKHGRVAMMAALGGVVQHYVKFPGFDSVPAGLGAVSTDPGTYGFIALFVLSGAFELAIWTQDANKEPGNFGDPLGLGQYNEDMRNKEINNGRFAMFAALGIVVADIATGKDAIQQFGI